MHIDHDTLELRLAPAGRCNWCGIPAPAGLFCSPDCAGYFRAWWLVIPVWKRTVYLWDDFTCQICGTKPLTANPYGLVIPDLDYLEVDHIIPVAKGGKTAWDNLQVLCQGCNRFKHTKVGLSNGELHKDKVEVDWELGCITAYLREAAKSR